MTRTGTSILLLSALLAFGLPRCLQAQATGATDELSVQQFFEQLNERTTPFEQFRFLSGPPVQRSPALQGFAQQLLATSSSFLGRPNDAIREFPIHDESEAPPALPDTTGFDVIPAVDWIATQAGGRQVIMVNEAHHKPQTRLLILALLPRLRALGFTHFAAETFLDQPMQAGYPTAKSGYYTREPVFAEIVREAARLGYTLVPYEFTDKGDESQQARETGEARNLAEVLARDPEARILVHAGYGHVSKSAGTQPDDADPMALEFMRLTGLPVLTIDQTRLTWEDGHAAERLSREFNVTSPSVLLDRETGSAWSAFPDQFDANVVLPASPASALRPDWLELGGRRRAVTVDMASCIGHLPCLAEARYANEGNDAIPADQFVVLAPEETGTPLYLAPGEYRLRLLGNDGTSLADHALIVPSTTPIGAQGAKAAP